jgi:hypothetical protein
MAKHWQDDEARNHLAKIQKYPSPSEKGLKSLPIQIKPNVFEKKKLSKIRVSQLLSEFNGHTQGQNL